MAFSLSTPIRGLGKKNGGEANAGIEKKEKKKEKRGTLHRSPECSF